MNWRTDRPTADVIVAEVKDRGYKIMYASNADTNYYLDDNGEEFSYTEFVKWADLEEDETVTDCHQLEEEIDRAIDDLEGVAEKDADGVLIAHLTLIEHLKDFARHFAKWGAEHLKKYEK